MARSKDRLRRTTTLPLPSSRPTRSSRTPRHSVSHHHILDRSYLLSDVRCETLNLVGDLGAKLTASSFFAAHPAAAPAVEQKNLIDLTNDDEPPPTFALPRLLPAPHPSPTLGPSNPPTSGEADLGKAIKASQTAADDQDAELSKAISLSMASLGSTDEQAVSEVEKIKPEDRIRDGNRCDTSFERRHLVRSNSALLALAVHPYFERPQPSCPASPHSSKPSTPFPRFATPSSPTACPRIDSTKASQWRTLRTTGRGTPGSRVWGCRFLLMESRRIASRVSVFSTYPECLNIG